MANSFDPFGFKARAEIAKYNAQAQESKTRRAEISGKIALIGKMFGSRRVVQSPMMFESSQKNHQAPYPVRQSFIIHRPIPCAGCLALRLIRSPAGEAMVGRLAEVVVGSGP